jgi:hypothetical protein
MKTHRAQGREHRAIKLKTEKKFPCFVELFVFIIGLASCKEGQT